MSFISFLHKAFVLISIFVAISTSVKTAMNLSFKMSSKPKLFQMITKKDKIQSYETHFEYEKTPTKENESKMKLDEVYNSIHNFKHRQIPEPSAKFDFPAYQKKVKDYCEHDYVTLEYFKRLNKISILKYALSSLRDCLKDNVLTIRDNSNPKNTNEKLLKDMIVALAWEPENKDYKCSDELRKYISHMNSCLRKNYDEDVSENPSFVECFSPIKDEYNENWMKINDNKVRALKYAKQLSDNLKTTLSSTNQYKAFESCTEPFKKYSNSAFGSSSDLNLRELYLLMSVLYHFKYKFDHINMAHLFHVITAINPDIEFRIYNDDRKYCNDNVKPLDYNQYAEIMMDYPILPDISEFDSYESYLKKKSEILDDLLKTDDKRSKYYNDYKRKLGQITEQNFKDMVKRRSIKTENDYTTYVKRMNIIGYLPLPENLWFKEKATSHEKIVQQLYENEFTEDLKKISMAT